VLLRSWPPGAGASLPPAWGACHLSELVATVVVKLLVRCRCLYLEHEHGGRLSSGKSPHPRATGMRDADCVMQLPRECAAVLQLWCEQLLEAVVAQTMHCITATPSACDPQQCVHAPQYCGLQNRPAHLRTCYPRPVLCDCSGRGWHFRNAAHQCKNAPTMHRGQPSASASMRPRLTLPWPQPPQGRHLALISKHTAAPDSTYTVDSVHARPCCKEHLHHLQPADAR
jgi:hypothetical protein